MTNAPMSSDIDHALGEYYRRIDRGERVDRAEFLSEFPHLASELEECLTTADSVELFGMVQTVSEDSRFGGRSGSGLPGESIDIAVELPTADVFLHRVEASGLSDAPTLARFIERSREPTGELPDSSTLALRMVEEGLLTTWQCRQLLADKPLVMGNYRLLDYLGHGGMSNVYLAEHTRMKRRVALKLLPRRLVSNSTFLDRFLREARATASLDHPNIIRAFDVDHDGPHYYLVMEYVEGLDLRQIVHERGPLDAATAADYIRQAACGLAHAHAAGMIHRDVKPANLLVNEEGVVKLLDLGLALPVDDQEQLTIEHDDAVLGTVDYMAPEQALDSHNVDERSDLYSLGCTLYYLLAGKPPYPDGTVAQKLLFHQSGQAAPLQSLRPDVPLGLIEVCQRLMAAKPADRYATAADVVQAIELWQAATQAAGDAASSGAYERVLPKPSPAAQPFAIAIAIGLFLALVVGGSFALWDSTPEIDDEADTLYADRREDPFATDLVWEPQPDDRNFQFRKGRKKNAPRVRQEPRDAIFDDDPKLIGDWHGPAALSFDTGQKFSGRGSLRVAGNWAAIGNVNAEIRQHPKPGQFRYLRFAWKKPRGEGVGLLVAMRDPAPGKKKFNERRWEYRAGHFTPQRMGTDEVITLDNRLPTDWVVVTRDLYQDCGEIRVFGFRIGLAPRDDIPLHLDHFYLARNLSDFPPLPAGALATAPPPPQQTPPARKSPPRQNPPQAKERPGPNTEANGAKPRAKAKATKGTEKPAGTSKQ